MKSKIIKEITRELKYKYPHNNISVNDETISDDVFITIDSENIYLSDEYAELILDLTEKYLWSNKIYNVYFDYSESARVNL